MAGAITNALATTSPSSTSANNHTWTGAAIGTAAADRYVIASFGGYSNSAETSWDSVTIGGVSATLLVSSVSTLSGFVNHCKVESWIALVPTGTTATVLLDGPDVGDYSAMNLILSRATGIQPVPSATVATSSNGSKTIAGTLVIPSNGVGFGVVHPNSNDGTTGYAWTNLTELSDADGSDSIRMTSASSTSAGSASRSCVVTTPETAANTFLVGNLVAFNETAVGHPVAKRMGAVKFVGNRAGQNSNLWRKDLGWRQTLSGLLVPPKPKLIRA